MTPRNELKFYISSPSAKILESRLSAVLQKDSHTAENSSYRIQSLYFDDPSSSAYRDKVDGIDKRVKYRIRYYNYTPDFIRLEKKEKKGALCFKEGVCINENQARALLPVPGDLSLEKGNVYDELSFLIRTSRFAPLLFVDYRRRAFLHPVGNVRITLDDDVFASPFEGALFPEEGRRVPVLSPNTCILEVKFNTLFPPYLARLLEDIPKEHLAISKYCKCYEALF